MAIRSFSLHVKDRLSLKKTEYPFMLTKKTEIPLTQRRKIDGVNELDENDKISNLLDPDAKKQTFGRKSQNWQNLRDENGILLYFKNSRQFV
ncbi:hypothetical protein Hanom_Chr11g00998401 [Helianthus anomalus]